MDPSRTTAGDRAPSEPTPWVVRLAVDGTVAALRLTGMTIGVARREGMRAAERAWADLVTRSIDLLAERLDLADEVIRHVDLTRVASAIDLDAVLERVDVQALAERIDLDALLARVDLDAVIERVDLDAVVDRIDLAELARAVIEELDVPELIRGSTATMTGEAVEEVRIGTARADGAVSRAVERLLRRNGSAPEDHPPERGRERSER